MVGQPFPGFPISSPGPESVDGAFRIVGTPGALYFGGGAPNTLVPAPSLEPRDTLVARNKLHRPVLWKANAT